MDLKKLCKFNFNRQDLSGGHCKNESCKFLHPDPPTDEDDPIWCPDDHEEDGGCLNVHCPLYHPRSCHKSQIKQFRKRRTWRSPEQSRRRITTRSESPSYDTMHEVRKRTSERSESPVAKRKKLTTRMEKGCRYKVSRDFSREDVSSKYRHHQKLSVSAGELVTFVSMCDSGQSCDNYCSFARVRNQFGGKGFIPVKCLEDDKSVPLTCPLAPVCEDLFFTDEEALHRHLCLHHFREELRMHLKNSNRCPICDERMKSDDLILHFGSAPHHQVVSLLTTGIGKAVKSFKEQSDILLQETVMKINLGHQESIKEIKEKEENKVFLLQDKLLLSETEKNELIDEKRAIESERDDLDSEKIDCINEINLILGDRFSSKVTDLKSVTEIVKKLRYDNMSSSKEGEARDQHNYPQAESSLKTYHNEKKNTFDDSTMAKECSGKEQTNSLSYTRVADLNCTVNELKDRFSRTTQDLSNMEKERDELDEKLEASEQMRKEDSMRFSRQLEALKTELAAHDKLFSELDLKLKKKDSIIKNIIPLIENHLERS